MRAFFSILTIIFTVATVEPNNRLAANDVVVLAAASLATALDEVIANRANQTDEEPNVMVSYGGTGGLSRQIENGLPAHILIAASRPWVNRLVEKGLLEPNSATDILTNRLALITNKDNTSGLRIYYGFPLAETLGNGRLAIGEVASVPAGIYAKQALQALGSWESVKDKLAPAKDVRAALMLVQRRETELGIVYKTDAKVGTDIRILDTFDPNLHSPIYYTVAMLTQRNTDLAQSLFDYLTGEIALKIFERHGFLRP